MKKLFTIVILYSAFGLFGLNAQSPSHTWVSTMGGTSNEEVGDMAIDSHGNSYIVGTFEGTADFDPGVGVSNLSSNGSKDIFIQKLDNNGALVWVKKIGGVGGDVATGLALDTNNALHIVGHYRNTVDFDPGTAGINRTSGGFDDAFLLKLDSNGNFEWVQTLGRPGRGQFEQLHAVTIDNQGNIITLGSFTGAFDMDPGSGANFTTYSGSGTDIWLQKWNSTGNFVWGRYFGNSVTTNNTSLAVDASNNIYFAGGHAGSIDFQWGSGIGNPHSSSGLVDAYLVKYSSGGTYLYNYAWGGSGFDLINDISIDLNNNVYVTGQFTGSPDFNPGSATNSISSNGLNDAFISKFNSTGGYSWTRTFGSFLGDIGEGIATDNAGNVYTVGYVGGNTDFDPGTGIVMPSSSGSFDAYIHKMDGAGVFQWVAYLGSTGSERSINIGIDSSNAIIHAGNFSTSALDFSLGNNTAIHSAVGGNDLFVQKIEECLPTNGIDVHSVCGTFTWIDGNTYNQSNNTATYTLLGANANGCDSVVTLDLTILPTYATAFNQSACKSFLWPSNGKIYNTSGTYRDTITSSLGCDSVLIMTLNIDTVDTRVVQNGITLTSLNNLQPGPSKQWVDCNNNYAAIPGAIGKSFTPTQNGSYALILTDPTNSICADTSACFNIISVGIEETTIQKSTNIYPNPTTGIFTLEVRGDIKYNIVQVFSLEGKLLKEQSIQSKQELIDVSNLSSGIYFVKYGKTINKLVLTD